MTKQEMLDLINKCDIQYYECNNPIMSDFEYDKLRKEFIEKYGTKDLNYVPSDEINGFTKRKHDFAMMSLDKIKIHEIDEIKKFFEKFNSHVMIQPKIDGLTLVDYGNNVRVTRGTGSRGDILPLANKIQMGKADGYVVRGEAYIDKKTFLKINEEREKNFLEPFENARNAAAGILRNFDDNKYYTVGFLAYEIRRKGQDITNHHFSYDKDIEMLKEFGYETPDTWIFDDFNKLVSFINNFDKNSMKYDIDGLVMKCLEEDSFEKYGVTGHHRKDAIAIKFETEKKETRIIDVEWSLGRTKVTPVAILEPIRLAGTTVQRASIHNVDWIKEKHLTMNAKVLVEKANEIIPYITSVIEDGDKEIEIPSVCPVCGQPLVKNNGQLACVNPSCKGRISMQINYIASKPALNIANLSAKTADKIIESYQFQSWHDIFKITKEDLMNVEGFAEKSAQKLADNIKKSVKNVSLDTFIYCLGIDHFGKMNAKIIAEYLGTYENLVKEIENKCKNLYAIKGIGSAVIDNLANALNDVLKLHEYINPEAMEKKEVKENALNICVTGKFDQPRSYFQKLIEDAGHVFKTSVTKDTNYLLIGEDAGGNKLKAAEKYNTKVLHTEDELKEILK